MRPSTYEFHNTGGQVSAHLVLFEERRSRIDMNMVPFSSWRSPSYQLHLSNTLESQIQNAKLSVSAFPYLFPNLLSSPLTLLDAANA